MLISDFLTIKQISLDDFGGGSFLSGLELFHILTVNEILLITLMIIVGFFLFEKVR